LCADDWWSRDGPLQTARSKTAIINVASDAGKYRSNTGIGGIPYAAAKAGAMQLTKAHGVPPRATEHYGERDCTRQRVVRGRDA
jgi:NAD(P)-dependent dehydrogenase (short-subunit alcohol dehydrogenase family)